MQKLFHKDHGFVFTSDETQIKALLAKGAEFVDKCSEYGKLPEVKEVPKVEVPERRNPPMKRKRGY